MDVEHGNLRAALTWLDQIGDTDAALLLSGRLFWFWYVRGHMREGRERLDHALARAPAAPADARARALLGVAVLTHWQGNDARAASCLEQSLAFWQEVGDQWGVAFTRGMLGVVAEDAGNFAQARPLLEEALRLFRMMGDRANAALVLAHIGVIALGEGDLERAIPRWQEALEVQREVGDTWGASVSLSYLGLAACDQRQFAHAATVLAESLSMRWAMRAQKEVAHGIANFATLAASCGQHIRAARLFGAAEAEREAIGLELHEPERMIYARAVAVAREHLLPGVFASSWADGRALLPEHAVAEALATAPTPAALPVPEATTDGDVRLTTREREVLRLLVLGKTDREIAAELFVSLRTAHGHVARIFTKLDVHTRTAAATTAVAAGIVISHPLSP